MPVKNEILPIKIDSVSNDGNGVGRASDGLAVFVPDTAPGDFAEIRIVKLRSGYAFGRLEKLLSSSPLRADPDCGTYKRCGGCSLRHLRYSEEKNIKQGWVEDAFRRIGKFSVPCSPILSADSDIGYRNKAMFPVQSDTHGNILLGLYARRSHQVVPQTDCMLQPPEFSVIARLFQTFLQKHRISCYDEKSGRGLVRHLYLRKAFQTGELMVCVIANGATLPHSPEWIRMLEDSGLPVRSVCLNVNRKQTNVLLGNQTILLSGNRFITDELLGLRFELSPESFYQVHHAAAEILYRKAKEYAALTGSELLLDLYCGTGTIGLSMADSVKKVIGIEVVEQAVRDAVRNAEINGITNAEFLCADASQAARKFAADGVRPDVAVIDPPRKGCDPEVLKALADMAPSRIVMISCNPATAARDCALLRESGYQLQEFTPVDLFPRTNHVETCVLLSHKNS